jgi:hypothetical protein
MLTPARAYLSSYMKTYELENLDGFLEGRLAL